MLHNANLDKSEPTRRSKAELLKDLKKWEEERKAKKKKTTVDDSYIVSWLLVPRIYSLIPIYRKSTIPSSRS
jgi:hypothetical protein